MPSATQQKWLPFLLIVLAALLLAGCTTETPNEWLEAPGWGRAAYVGTTRSASPALPAIDADGNAYFVLTASSGSRGVIRLVALDHEAEPLWETEYILKAFERPAKPAITLHDGRFKIFWIDREKLFRLEADLEGNFLGEPELISGEHVANYFDLSQSQDGQLSVWFSGDAADPGVYAVQEDGEPLNIDPEGYKIQLIYDRTGDLHASWIQNQPGELDHDYFHARYPGGEVSLGREELVYSASISITSGLIGPELGLEDETGYLFWAEEARTGQAAGIVQAYYVSFDLDGGPAGNRAALLFPNGYKLNYSRVVAPLNSGGRAYSENQVVRLTSSMSDLYANPYQAEEVALAFRSRLPYLRNKFSFQVGLTFLEDQRSDGHQLLSFNPAQSQLPTIQSDQDGNLYFSWLDSSSGGAFRVYYSSTALETNEALNQFSSNDAYQISLESLFGLLSGAILIPFPVLWVMLPAVLTFVLAFLRKEDEPITAPGTALTLVLGLIAYTLAKMFSMPGILTYVPFSAWVPILPESWSEYLRIGVPILTGVLGLLAAWNFTYRRKNRTPLFFVLIFAAVDGILTIAIYGVIFYSAF